MTTQKLPTFQNEEEERAFWSTHSLLEFQENFERVELNLSNLKPTSRLVSIRLPEWMITQLKVLANMQDIPYQSLVKIFLNEKIQEEFKNRQVS